MRPRGQCGEGGGGAAVPIGRPARHIMIGSWTPITTSITPQGEIHEVKELNWNNVGLFTHINWTLKRRTSDENEPPSPHSHGRSRARCTPPWRISGQAKRGTAGTARSTHEHAPAQHKHITITHILRAQTTAKPQPEFLEFPHFLAICLRPMSAG